MKRETPPTGAEIILVIVAVVCIVTLAAVVVFSVIASNAAVRP